MIKLAPSILSADFVNLQRDIDALAKAGADYVHVDVMDGAFVPNITIGMPVVAAIRRITDLPLDVHLMIDRPVRYVEEFCKAGADIVTIHVEADTLEHNLQALQIIRQAGVRAAISVEAEDPGGGCRAVSGAGRSHPGHDRGARLWRPEIHGGHDAKARGDPGNDQPAEPYL